MSKLRLLGRTSSINVRKVLWTIAELGILFTHEDEWGSSSQPTTLPSFKILNPNAQIPVIQDENGVLWESNTICRYLAFKHQGISLLPNFASERAKVEMWMDWQATDLNTAWRYAFMALVRKDLSYDSPAQVAQSIERWNEMMGRLDAHLARSGCYVTGAQFTLADIVLGLSAHRWEMTPMTHAVLPSVQAWLTRLRSRRTAANLLDSQYP